MMDNNIKLIKDQLKAMLDATDNKDEIEQIGKLNSLVDNIEAEHTQLKNEQKDLIKDYKELIKHTSFAPNGQETNEVSELKALTFEDFLAGYKK